VKQDVWANAFALGGGWGSVNLTALVEPKVEAKISSTTNVVTEEQ
jgi:hypothetical protein